MILLSITALFLIGCSSTTKVRYVQPNYYEFNLSRVELEPIPQLAVKEHVEFADKSQKFVKMPTWFFLKMLDVNDIRKNHLKIYKKLYEWALEDVERYEKFVERQKKR